MNTSAGLHGCYEYDGLKLLRVDEVYDSNSNNDLDDDFEANGGLGNWRTVEASTYGPVIVGNLLGKVVYTHTDNDATPDSQADCYYHYDHVGNVYLITDDEGEEVYRFAQDAFGNELDFGNYTGDSWATAAAAGIGEHQTGKWIDEFSGLYFFHARWYDSEVGRFLGRDPVPQVGGNIYSLSANSPVMISDPTGRWRCWGPGCTPPPDWDGTVDPICCDACAGAAGALAGVFTVGHGDNNRNGDNALRHCMASCITTQWCGASCSESYWNGRETNPSNPFHRMDIHNNNQGRACGSQGSCYECCLQKMREGELACLYRRLPVRCGQ